MSAILGCCNTKINKEDNAIKCKKLFHYACISLDDTLLTAKTR